jgi:hypothetical protein
MARREGQEGPFEQLGEAVGGALGKAAGRANDMALNAVGSLLSSAMQALGGWWSTPDAEQAARSFGEPEDRAFREHYESSRRGGTPQEYERARPAYQLGYVARRNPEYQSKPFDQVEAQVERAWEALGRERSGEWSEVRDQVSFGYTYRTPGAPNPT